MAPGMGEQVPVSRDAIAQAVGGERALEVGPGVAYRRLGIVNVVLLGDPGEGDRSWVLVDAGLPGTAGAIAEAAAERFGEGLRPAAIVLTHGHFDHVGALAELAARWDAPVHAHPLERPYLDGSSAYPPPDPSVGGGLMARLAPLYPRGSTRAAPRTWAIGCARCSRTARCRARWAGGGCTPPAIPRATSPSGAWPIGRWWPAMR